MPPLYTLYLSSIPVKESVEKPVKTCSLIMNSYLKIKRHKKAIFQITLPIFVLSKSIKI